VAASVLERRVGPLAYDVEEVHNPDLAVQRRMIMTLEPQLRYATIGETIRIITEGRRTKLQHLVKVRFVFLNGSFVTLSHRTRRNRRRTLFAQSRNIYLSTLHLSRDFPV
jgi:hypothetical protein